MTQTLLFDVDGTLSDTFDKTIAIINDLAEKYRYPMVKDKSTLRHIDWRTLPAYLGISRFRRKRYLKTLRDKLRETMSQGRLSPELDDVLKIITTSGYQVGAMASLSLTDFTGLSAANDYFSLVDVVQPAGDKARVLGDFLSRFGLKAKEVVFVGDEIEDIEVAKRLGMISIGCTWGLNSAFALQEQKPDYVVNKPSELLTVVSQLDD